MSMTHLARDIANSRLHHKPSFLCRQHSDVIADLREIASSDLSELKSQLDGRKLEILSAYGYDSIPDQSWKPFAYADGTAIIPVHGLLLNRMSWGCSFATGYNFIRSQMLAAEADQDVNLIVFDFNSGGGVCAGCPELSEEISTLDKPTLAVVDSRCYSAAFMLAVSTDRIVVTPSGGVGSIGCVVMHVDLSDALQQDGIKISFIDAPEGGDKVLGNPYERLSDRARADIQQAVNYNYDLFVGAVVDGRGISEDDVRATKAGCFQPPEALELGLIDAIQSPSEAVANFFNDITPDGDDDGDSEMATKADGTTAVAAAAPAPAAPAQTFTQADIERSVAAALSADRTRQAGIKGCEEAKGREALADHLALGTSLSVDEAKAILAAAPKVEPKTETDTAGQAQSGFKSAMSNTPNPNIGPDAGKDGPGGSEAENDTPEARATRLLRSYGQATGTVIELKPVKTG